MGLLPIPAPRLTQGASRAGFWRAAALYDKRLPLRPLGCLIKAPERKEGNHIKEQ